MKPRTKLQIEVAELSDKLPKVTAAQENWAKEHCFTHYGHKCKDELWCSDCSKMWVATADESLRNSDNTKCPYCHHKLKIKVSRKQKEDESSYMTIVTVTGRFQVLRHVYVNRHARKNQSVGYSMIEVCQQWIDEEANITIMAKPMNTGCGGWLHAKPLSIKSQYTGWRGYHQETYAISGYVYPEVRLLPILKRNGLKSSFHDVTPSSLITSLLKGGIAEMLLKTKQYDLLRQLHRRGRLSHQWAINICNRNGYIVKDASLWQDYLDMLDYFHLDTHNAKYVCPKNLKVEHDRLHKKRQAIEAKQRQQRDRIAAMKKGKQQREDILSFYQRMERFFGMTITGGDITIQPLESVTQFYKEGKEMHHCVYSYYNRIDCLILSARIGNKKIETIEVNLKTLQVVQSRSASNGTSAHHDEIINLVNKNIGMIKQRMAS